MRKVPTAPLLTARGSRWMLAALTLACLACDPPRPAELPAPPAEPPIGRARAVCEAACARSIRCSGPRGAACPCEDGRGPEVLRPDWAEAVIACLGRTGCDAPDDCAAEAYRAAGVTPLGWPPVVMRCLQRGAACGGSSETCRRLAALNDDARAEVSSCFDLSCDDSAACLDSFVASRITPSIPAWR